MDLAAAKMIGAGIAVVALLGVGIGIGNIFSNLITAIARNPAAKGDVMPVGLLGFALTESIALIAFVTAMMILFS
jgi:F0F1-type ATP synthase membrane subunit c/vacuolar-type H+-ATPase subunit K